MGRNFVTDRLIGRLHATTTTCEAEIFENLDSGPTRLVFRCESLIENRDIGWMKPDPPRCVNRALVDGLPNQSVNIELTRFDRLMHDPRSHRNSDLHCEILQLSQILDADLGGLFELLRTIRKGIGESLKRVQVGVTGTTGRRVGGQRIGACCGRTP